MNIVWLKRDIRVEDHAAFFEARKRGPVIAVYIYEPEYWALPDTSDRQWGFIKESLTELQAQLDKLGVPLVLFSGDAIDAFRSILEVYDVASVHAHQETGNHWTFERDKRVAQFLESQEIPFHQHMQHGVFRRLETRNGWAGRWDAMMFEPGPPLPARLENPIEQKNSLSTYGFLTSAENLPKPNNDAPQRQRGGRSEGIALLASFLAGRGENYRKAMSSPLEGADACSRISPHLAAGTLSMRECFQAAIASLGKLDREDPANRKMRQSLVSFIGRLHWHCHFIQKLETSPNIEWKELHPAYSGMRATVDAELLERWYKGETGWPFLDACMRSLHKTGWLNFRMRAMVIAIASYHLWQPWQRSGQLLGSLFTDYEPGIHWPQVQMQSGTTGINTIRIYNPVKQGHDQDPDGVFIKRWVPELAHLSGKDLHEPWRLDAPVSGYPSIVVDHQQAAREARDRIWRVRKEKGFGRAAKKVLEKHSSRKSVNQPDHKGRRRRKAENHQLGFDF